MRTEIEVDKTKTGWEKLIHITLTDIDVEAMEFDKKCKLRAASEDTPGNKIYNEELKMLSANSTAIYSNIELASKA